MSFNIWTPQGLVIPNVGGSYPANPNVLYETGSVVLGGGSPVFKMWCGDPYGLYYLESADGLTSWTPYASNPVIADVVGGSNGCHFRCWRCPSIDRPNSSRCNSRQHRNSISWNETLMSLFYHSALALLAAFEVF